MIIVCGKSALQPDTLRKVCQGKPHDEVYALPWVKTKGELGCTLTNRGGRPNRLFPCEPNTDESAGEFQVFDKKMDEGDALGRMAHLVASGQPVLNEVMKSPFSPFYGKVIVRDGTSSFMVDCSQVDKYFPAEPLSAKLYAATTAMVRFHNTPMFSEASGCGLRYVDVVLASQYLPGSVSFMNFYYLMGARRFVGLEDLLKFSGRELPRFRYNRGYRSNHAGRVLRTKRSPQGRQDATGEECPAGGAG